MSQSRFTARGAFGACLLLALAVAAASPARAEPPAGEEPSLEQKVEVLTEEVSRLREQMNIPETDRELRGAYGMGPAASKVYGVAQGISFGGYGEFYFSTPYGNTAETGAVNSADLLRLIAYVGYKFSDRIVMNAEIEYEHATTGSNYAGESGEVAVEFAYLDFLIDPAFNVRTGNVLIPMGFINQMHEPTTFHGSFRPTIERTIIPTTWRELGAGIHGARGSLSYSAYAVNGLNATEFDASGVRGGRQEGNQAIWEDVGGVAGADYAATLGHGTLIVGASLYYGGADQGLARDSTGAMIDVTNRVYEAHGEFHRGGFSARALVAASHIENAAALSHALFADGGVLTAQVPESQLGWYAEAAYDIAPLLWKNASFTLSPWARYEAFNLQNGVSAGTGLAADPALDGSLVAVGLESKPHPNVVLKLDLLFPANKSTAPVSDEIRFGAGFIY
ncbi:MAG TPA: hypothetical protein VFX92_10355 [Candidatus Krumholzibacteria bacterium]|nr:hypothetical protein [Candidatus Krumholzibacteria bacterium]